MCVRGARASSAFPVLSRDSQPLAGARSQQVGAAQKSVEAFGEAIRTQQRLQGDAIRPLAALYGVDHNL